MKYTFLMIAILTVAYSGVALAQSPSQLRPSEQVTDRSYYANPKFDFMVRAAMNSMNDNFRFDRFRSLYTQTRQYDPLGDDTIKEMQNLAYTIQNGETQDDKLEALEAYRNLVMMHMANIRVVAQALSFTKLDKAFGRADFFTWLRKGLIRDVMNPQDGKSLKTAYNVVTLTEETVLLGQLGVSILATSAAQESQIYYNMHEVEDLRTGQKSTIFVNTTRPMRYLNAKYKQSGGGSFSILRQ